MVMQITLFGFRHTFNTKMINFAKLSKIILFFIWKITDL